MVEFTRKRKAVEEVLVLQPHRTRTFATPPEKVIGDTADVGSPDCYVWLDHVDC